MFRIARGLEFLCARNAYPIKRYGTHLQCHRGFGTSGERRFAESPDGTRERDSSNKESDEAEEKEEGAMFRRLSEMTETNLEEGGRSARKALEEAGFDEELKDRLLERIADATFKSENSAAISQAKMSSSADKRAREIAGAKPWTGSETIQDATLRMLNDAHKPIKRAGRIPSPFRPPKKVDTGRPSKKAPSSGIRLANARDRSSVYSSLNDNGSMSEKEREEYRKQLKERFGAGARPMPQSFSGLAALANERIEDAIARGKFKNLPRGKKIERDVTASSAFLDTTEYFMNKIIQKQDIVPPWIEKQQEVVSTASKFRSRLRADWRRHAARMISSSGGSLEDQIRRAQHFAAAEAALNPPAKRVEEIKSVDNEGHMSQITLTGKLIVPKTTDSKKDGPEPTMKISVEESGVPSEANSETRSTSTMTNSEPVFDQNESMTSEETAADTITLPFRDTNWEQTERAYLKAAIDNLNTLTRSYNLMAPNLAKRPYYSLDRELQACFADVAPQVPGEIRNRANAPKVKVDVSGHVIGGVLEEFVGGKTRVYDDRRPQYGFKQFWRDLFGSKGT